MIIDWAPSEPNLKTSDLLYESRPEAMFRSRIIWLWLSVANSYSRGDREFEKTTAMLFPGEIAQRGRMHDHVAAHLRRRISVQRCVCSRLIEVEPVMSKLSLQVNAVPKENLVKKFAP